MTANADYDRYASELTERFEEMMKWAIEHWPRKDFPLLSSDFSRTRREISEIVGPKLGDGHPDDRPEPRTARQFRPISPMPWP